MYLLENFRRRNLKDEMNNFVKSVDNVNFYQLELMAEI